VDLALDTPDSVYKALQNFYWLYPDAEAICRRARDEQLHERDINNLRFWRDACYAAKALVSGELHLEWRLRAKLEAAWKLASELISRFIGGVWHSMREAVDLVLTAARACGAFARSLVRRILRFV